MFLLGSTIWNWLRKNVLHGIAKVLYLGVNMVLLLQSNMRCLEIMELKSNIVEKNILHTEKQKAM